MSKKFEDQFMDLQSELISLSLEVTDKKVDKIYAYASIEEKSQMFNAFFEAAGEIKTLNQLGIDHNRMMQFLKLGTEDLDKIKALGKEYAMPVPTELKLHYDVKTGKYNADYPIYRGLLFQDRYKLRRSIYELDQQEEAGIKQVLIFNQGKDIISSAIFEKTSISINLKDDIAMISVGLIVKIRS